MIIEKLKTPITIAATGVLFMSLVFLIYILVVVSNERYNSIELIKNNCEIGYLENEQRYYCERPKFNTQYGR